MNEAEMVERWREWEANLPGELFMLYSTLDGRKLGWLTYGAVDPSHDAFHIGAQDGARATDGHDALAIRSSAYKEAHYRAGFRAGERLAKRTKEAP